MTRAALLLLIATPGFAAAQGFSLPYRTGSSFYQPSFGRYNGGFYGGLNRISRVPNVVPFNNLGYLSPGGFYDPGFYTTVGPDVVIIPSFAGQGPVLQAPTPPPLVGAGAPTPGAPVAALPRPAAPQPAELRLELPASADVWVNGVQQTGRDASRTLTSPPVPAGGSHVFKIKAKWTAQDEQYEWDRDVTVKAGDRSKVVVGAGFKVGN